MTEAEIRKYDPDDVELKKLMGGKFLDKTQKAHSEPVRAESQKVSEYTADWENVAEDAGTDAETHRKPTFSHELMECTKSALTFGGLNLLIFYWQSAGLMEPSVAVPSMLACASLLGWNIGKAVGKR